MQKTTSPRGIPRFVGRAEVAEALGYSVKTLSREIQRGHVPRPVQLSPNRVGWPIEVIQHLLQSRIARVTEQAVSDPSKLKAEPIENAVAREMTRQLGEDVHPDDVIFGAIRQLSKDDAEDAVLLHWLALWYALEERFGQLSQNESLAVTYGLFPAMRQLLDKLVLSNGAKASRGPACAPLTLLLWCLLGRRVAG